MKLIEAFLTILLRGEIFWAPVGIVMKSFGNKRHIRNDIRVFEGITDCLFLFNIARVLYSTAIKYSRKSETKHKFRPIEFLVPALDFIAIVIRLICICLNRFILLKSLALLLRIPYIIQHPNPQHVILDFPNVLAFLKR